MPWSMRNEEICSTAGKILRPPDAPIANHGFPPHRAITGHMLVSGRFAGASEFGVPGRGSNHMTPLFIRMPVAGRATLLPEPKRRGGGRGPQLAVPWRVGGVAGW